MIDEGKWNQMLNRLHRIADALEKIANPLMQIDPETGKASYIEYEPEPEEPLRYSGCEKHGQEWGCPRCARREVAREIMEEKDAKTHAGTPASQANLEAFTKLREIAEGGRR